MHNFAGNDADGNFGQIIRTGTVMSQNSPGGRLTNRSSGRVIDKVPSPIGGARAAKLNR